MTKNIDQKRHQIIKEINELVSEHELEAVSQFLKEVRWLKEHGAIFKDMKDTISLDKLVEEQNFKGMDEAQFNQLVEQLDIQEPIQELLDQLSS
ncbi:MAG: hypothetical protein AAF798_07115 [Bacteroidota bacterium]